MSHSRDDLPKDCIVGSHCLLGQVVHDILGGDSNFLSLFKASLARQVVIVAAVLEMELMWLLQSHQHVQMENASVEEIMKEINAINVKQDFI